MKAAHESSYAEAAMRREQDEDETVRSRSKRRVGQAGRAPRREHCLGGIRGVLDGDRDAGASGS
jgi:hypothetical protein